MLIRFIVVLLGTLIAVPLVTEAQLPTPRPLARNLSVIDAHGQRVGHVVGFTGDPHAFTPYMPHEPAHPIVSVALGTRVVFLVVHEWVLAGTARMFFEVDSCTGPGYMYRPSGATVPAVVVHEGRIWDPHPTAEPVETTVPYYAGQGLACADIEGGALIFDAVPARAIGDVSRFTPPFRLR